MLFLMDKMDVAKLEIVSVRVFWCWWNEAGLLSRLSFLWLIVVLVITVEADSWLTWLDSDSTESENRGLFISSLALALAQPLPMGLEAWLWNSSLVLALTPAEVDGDPDPDALFNSFPILKWLRSGLRYCECVDKWVVRSSLMPWQNSIVLQDSFLIRSPNLPIDSFCSVSSILLSPSPTSPKWISTFLEHSFVICLMNSNLRNRLIDVTFQKSFFLL